MTTPLRLPGSVAQVDASPPGPGTGAFFDMDGTLVAGFTVAAVTRDRLRHREVGAAEFLQMMQLAVEYRLGRQPVRERDHGGGAVDQGPAGRGRR